MSNFLFFGDERRDSAPLLDRLWALRKTSNSSLHTDRVIAIDDKPSQALRRSQLEHAARHRGGAEGRGGAAVSAGNTGALMAIAKFVLRTLPGIDRPAIATFFPTRAARA